MRVSKRYERLTTPMNRGDDELQPTDLAKQAKKIQVDANGDAKAHDDWDHHAR